MATRFAVFRSHFEEKTSDIDYLNQVAINTIYKQHSFVYVWGVLITYTVYICNMWWKDELKKIEKRGKQKLERSSSRTAIITDIIMTKTREEIVDEKNAQVAPPGK